MAEGVVIRFKADSTEYDARLKRSIEQMKSMEDQAKKLQGSIDRTDEGYVKFVQSLGQMDTVAKSSRTALREYSESILYLQQQYKALSDVEKSGDVGKAMAASIQQLKVRAAEAQDTIGDLNEELKHMASDTSFTDGVGLMTRTVGSCAAAITAWTGDSKEMEVVIKDLAKIGTTVAAVEQLTKAFQKQNLVLLKNPYVAAAAAIAAIGVAIAQIVKKTNELTAAQKDMQTVQEKSIENCAEEVTRIETLNSILHDNTKSLDERRDALNAIQDLVPDYHGALTDEGVLMNDNAEAIRLYVTELQRAATAQAAFDQMVEIQKQRMDALIRKEKAEAELKAAESRASAPTAGVATGGAGAISYQSANAGVRQSEVRTAKSALESIDKELKGYESRITSLQSLVDANGLNTSTTTTTKTGKGGGGGGRKSSGGNVHVNVEPVLPEGSLAELEKQLSKAQEKFRMATTDDNRAAAKKEIDDISAAIDRMNGKLEEVPAEGSIAAMRQSLSELQNAWENAADDGSRAELKKQIDEVSEALSIMEGKTDDVVNALSMWKDHAAKIEETKARLAEFQAMMGDTSLSEDQRNWAAGMAESYKQELDEMMGATEEAADNMSSKFEMVKESLDNMSTGVGAISTLGNSLNDLKGIGEDLASAFSGEMDAWDALMTVFNSGIGIMQTVISVMEAINTLQELSSTLSQKKVADQAAETTAVVTGKSTEAAANLQEAGTSMTAAGANAAESSSAAGKAVAGIPIVGPILAVAAIAAVLAATFAAMSKAKSSGKFASGGIIPGNSYSGDKLTANVNSGELILNRAQQSNIAGQLQNSNPFGNLALSMDLKGEDIQICLDNNRMRRGR